MQVSGSNIYLILSGKPDNSLKRSGKTWLLSALLPEI